jgi:hypothetical protein
LSESVCMSCPESVCNDPEVTSDGARMVDTQYIQWCIGGVVEEGALAYLRIEYMA